MPFDLENVAVQPRYVAIITGANSGIGLETAKALARKQMTVVMACRNAEKALQAISTIKTAMPEAKLTFIPLDLANFSSIEEFARKFKEEFQQLHLLINNAGVMVPPLSYTEEGFESQIGINYLGHFHLTNLLFPLLDNTPDSRVVSLSSIAHKGAKIDFNNLNAEKGYSKMKAYAQSKLACLMFALEFNRKLHKIQSGVKSVVAHPGVSPTNLMQHLPDLLLKISAPLMPMISHEPQEAAQPIIMAALDPEAIGGEYFGPTGFKEMKGPPGIVQANANAYDQRVAEQLWEAAELYTNKKFSVITVPN